MGNADKQLEEKNDSDLTLQRGKNPFSVWVGSKSSGQRLCVKEVRISQNGEEKEKVWKENREHKIDSSIHRGPGEEIQ